MGSLREYSGLTAKVKAMRSRLISTEEYAKIIEFKTLAELAEYLKGIRGYAAVLYDADTASVHRETIEHAIIYSVYNDFQKMYKFANLEQRKYLKLYFIRYEVELIKRAIRHSSRSYMTDAQSRFIRAIFGKYSRVDFAELFHADNIREIVMHLEGTIYYEPLKQVLDAGRTGTFDFELALDMFYFKYMWRKRRTNFKGSELKSMTDSIGSEADMLNLTWIYRAKKFYRMTQSEIAALVIPVYHKVRKPQILKLIETNDLTELIGEIRQTAYGKFLTPDTFEEMELEKVCKRLVDKIYDRYYRTESYSMAVMSSYLRDKSEEMNKLITIVECIRYNYPKDAIAKEIL